VIPPDLFPAYTQKSDWLCPHACSVGVGMNQCGTGIFIWDNTHEQNP